MRYSIIIPVFNKADLTQQCLDALPASIADAGDGEVIVVDNASSDRTPQLLAQYPWIRVIRNEQNLGFAGANNQAARIARGRFLVLLNNDTEAWPGWLASMLRYAEDPTVGAVGARLLYADKSCQHGGVVVLGNGFGRQSILPFHHNYLVPFGDPDVVRVQDLQIVTGACLVTPRALYERLGGLDERYWNGFEDVDYCLKVKREGLRVVYDADAVLYHYESQSGIQRFRRASWNTELLERRWRGSVRFDALEKNIARGLMRFPQRSARQGIGVMIVNSVPTTIVVHGEEPAEGRERFEASLRANHAPIEAIRYAFGDEALATAREALRVRGLGCTAFVRGAARLEPGWLDELIVQLTSTPTVVAATFAPELPTGQNVAPVAPDGRCCAFNRRMIPQHFTLEPFDSLDGAIADLALRLVPLNLGTRGVSRVLGELPAARADASFERAHGSPLARVAIEDPERIERLLTQRPTKPRGLVSIVMLSWNAPEFTRTALASIAEFTSEPYEVIVVDNGSEEKTLEMLRQIEDPHVRVIYNATNRGFGGGNNDGIVAADGEYVVILNNDVIVTQGWLDALLAPFARIPSVGVTAPRSNKIVGDQEVVDATYRDIEGMHAYARARAQTHRGRGYLTDRAIGFCLCIDRRVIDEVGGFDERFEMGNFEDDDFSLRVRGAGYDIYVCDDSFIHHFGSQSFKANNVDHGATMRENWRRFAQKWGYPPPFPDQGYDPRSAIMRGFDRTKHYAPLPPRRTTAVTAASDTSPQRDLLFVASIGDERAWSDAAEFVRRYLQAFDASSPVSLAIGSAGLPDAATIGRRVMRALEKLGVSEQRCADVEISDESDLDAWRASLRARTIVDVRDLDDRSPSALRRLLEGSVA
ncbi:MAG: glycosyltransferase family 2 protein [bacterium]|nr:glycosyltransferase family 2 protein [bacterium]